MKRLGCRNVSIARLVPIVWFAIPATRFGSRDGQVLDWQAEAWLP